MKTLDPKLFLIVLFELKSVCWGGGGVTEMFLYESWLCNVNQFQFIVWAGCSISFHAYNLYTFLQPFELCRKKGKCTHTFCMLFIWLPFVHGISVSQTYQAFFFRNFQIKNAWASFLNFQLIMYTCIVAKIVTCIVLARFLFGINTNHITHAYAGKRTRIQPPILLCFHL